MKIELELPPEVAQLLKEMASETGLSPEELTVILLASALGRAMSDQGKMERAKARLQFELSYEQLKKELELIRHFSRCPIQVGSRSV